MDRVTSGLIAPTSSPVRRSPLAAPNRPLVQPAPKDRLTEKISQLSRPYLHMETFYQGSTRCIGKKNSGGELVQGIKYFEDGCIAVGTYNANGLLDGPDCMYLFKKNDIYTYGDYSNGNLKNGDVWFLDTNQTESGPRNSALRLEGKQCQRITSDGTVSKGTFDDGILKVGNIIYPNGTVTVVLDTPSAAIANDILSKILSPKIDPKSNWPLTLQETGATLSPYYRPIDTPNICPDPTSSRSTSLLNIVGIAAILGFILLAIAVLRTLGRTKLYVQPKLPTGTGFDRKIKRAMAKTIGTMDQDGNIGQAKVVSRVPLPKLSHAAHSDRLSTRIPQFHLVPPIDSMLTGYAIAFDKLTPVTIETESGPIFFSPDEAGRLAQLVTVHLNADKDWVPLLTPDTLKRVLPNAVSIQALDEVEDLKMMSKLSEKTLPTLQAKLNQATDIVNRFTEQFQTITYPSVTTRQIADRIPKLNLGSIEDFSTPIQTLIEKFNALVASPLSSARKSIIRSEHLAKLSQEKRDIAVQIRAQKQRAKIVIQLSKKIKSLLPLEECPPVVPVSSDIFISSKQPSEIVSREQLQERGLVRLRKLETQVEIWINRIRTQLHSHRDHLGKTEFKPHLETRVTHPGWIRLQCISTQLTQIRQQLIAISEQTQEEDLHPAFPTPGAFNICKSEIMAFVRWEGQELRKIATRIRLTSGSRVLGTKPVRTSEPVSNTVGAAPSPEAPAGPSKKQRLILTLDDHWIAITDAVDVARQLLNSQQSSGQLEDGLLDLHHAVINYVNLLLRIKYSGDPTHRRNANKFRELLVHNFHQNPNLCSPILHQSLQKKLTYLIEIIDGWGSVLLDNPHRGRWQNTGTYPIPQSASIDPSLAWHIGVRDVLCSLKWTDLTAHPSGESVATSRRRFEFSLACATELIDHAPKDEKSGALKRKLSGVPGYQNRLNRNIMMHSASDPNNMRWADVILDDISHRELIQTAEATIKLLELEMDLQADFPPLTL